MSKNTTKRIKLVVNWPTKPFFTVDDVFAAYPNVKEITLRVHLNNAKDEDGIIAEIGSIAGPHGRPKKVYTRTPVTSDLLDQAESQGISLVDRAREKLINVVSVTDKPVVTPTVFPLNVVTA